MAKLEKKYNLIRNLLSLKDSEDSSKNSWRCSISSSVLCSFTDDMFLVDSAAAAAVAALDDWLKVTSDGSRLSVVAIRRLASLAPEEEEEED